MDDKSKGDPEAIERQESAEGSCFTETVSGKWKKRKKRSNPWLSMKQSYQFGRVNLVNRQAPSVPKLELVSRPAYAISEEPTTEL
ncbi:hypothetical protein RB195_015905 [Necator americanus]|uniref:Uncharacterized protein n=1 Tax=Necator americanus TaxID=51031 RepID=A0ABR1E6P8_NECAM